MAEVFRNSCIMGTVESRYGGNQKSMFIYIYMCFVQFSAIWSSHYKKYKSHVSLHFSSNGNIALPAPSIQISSCYFYNRYLRSRSDSLEEVTPGLRAQSHMLTRDLHLL